MAGISIQHNQSRPRFRSFAGTGVSSPIARPPSADQVVLTRPTTHNRVKLLLSPGETKQALLDAIHQARHSFYIETFIWHDDTAGLEIAKALGERKQQAERLGQPFDAKVLIDSMGVQDQPTGKSGQAIIDLLRSYGVEVQIFNPHYVSLKALGVPITHRKLYISDNISFISGGRNIADEYLNPTWSPKGSPEPAWHDLAYQVTGDETARIVQAFGDDWEKAGGSPLATPAVSHPALGGSARVQTVVTDPEAHDYEIRAVHAKAIQAAQRQIVAIYPYFSDETLIQELIDAKRAKPNLDIKVMLPDVSEGGVPGWFRTLHDDVAKRLLTAGIQVRFYGGDLANDHVERRGSHMKALLVDDSLLSIGSANADARSFHDNYELNSLIADPGAIADFEKRVVQPDWAASRPVTIPQLDQLPWYHRLFATVLKWFDFLL
jgi:cardiolipin synthase